MTIPPQQMRDRSARYATFTRRFRAALIDLAVIAVALVATVFLGDAASGVPGSGRVAALLVFCLLVVYEPLFVWRRGATIGHRRNHLIVISDRTGRPPGPVRAIVRYLLKVLLGLPSFVMMAFSRRRQAVHDALTRTTVRLAPGVEDVTEEFPVERPADEDVLLPSRARRAMVGTVYLVVLFVLYGMAVSVIDPDGCVRAHDCGDGTTLLVQVAAVLWLATSVATVAATWKGMLWGARRRSLEKLDTPLA